MNALNRAIFHRYPQLHGDERLESGRVENPCHPDDPFLRELASLDRQMRHGVQRIGHDDQDGLRRPLHHLGQNRLHDLFIRIEQILSAHPGFSRNARRNDHNIRFSCLLVSIRSCDLCVKPFNGRCLKKIKGLPLGNPLDDIHQDNIPQLLFGSPMGSRRPHKSSANDRNLLPSHNVPSSSVLIPFP
jgi:hypothetical protein